jgi:hypothetical protein
VIYLTLVNKGGNHGHQIKDVLSALAICKVFEFKFVHTEHEYLDFFAIGDGEERVESLSRGIERFVISRPSYKGMTWDEANNLFSPLQEACKDKDCLIVIEGAVRIHPCQTIGWRQAGLIERDVYGEIVSETSGKFVRRHSHKPTSFREGTLNVAVHIDRGWQFNREKFPKLFEISRSKKPRYMFPIEYFERIVSQLNSVLGDREFDIHIYTERANSEEIIDTFAGQEHVTMHVGDNRKQKNYRQIHDIFFHFVKCDLLVTCNSSFSVVATYFRSGKPSLYHEHSHLFDLPGDFNLATDLDGSFDCGKLKNLL